MEGSRGISERADTSRGAALRAIDGGRSGVGSVAAQGDGCSRKRWIDGARSTLRGAGFQGLRK
ncbi:hypothetical protein SZ55_1048 [Pseudomonas sp. FeS53a]|nr:hypothetical protein SZ55_1048 [Pseudomonas sp. FeS53a]